MRLAAIVEYDGTDFEGFQRQRRPARPGMAPPRTVQEVLETAVRAATGEPVSVTGAGRTDTGVHAAGQVIHFDLTSRLTQDVRRLLLAVNAHLPPDVALRAVRHVGKAFHARYSAVNRTYRYRIANGEARSPLWRRQAHHVRRPLDVQRMALAGKALLGEHDFVAFAAQERTSQTRRTVQRVQVSECSAKDAPIWQNVMQHDRALAMAEPVPPTIGGGPEWQSTGVVRLVEIEVEANAFLRHMMRRIAGTLIRAGLRQIEPEEVAAILAGRVKLAAGPTTPAHGLCLQSVCYRPEDM